MKLKIKFIYGHGLVFLASCCLLSSIALADWQLDPSILYFSSQTNSGSTSSTLYGNLALGYHFTGPFFLGATLNYQSTSPGTSTYTSYGPTVGLETDNVEFLGTYFVGSSYNNGATTYNGSGYQISLAYVLPISSSVFLGPQISYRSLSEGTASGENPYNTVIPYFEFIFHI